MGVTTEFGYAHHSGRFDVNPGLMVSTVLNIAAMSKVAIIAFTEIDQVPANEAISKALHRIAWDLIHVGLHSDIGIGFDTKVFKLIYKEIKRVGRTAPDPRTPYLRLDYFALFALLKHIDSGEMYVVSVSHLPSNVEGRGGWLPSARARSHRQATRAWHHELIRLQYLWKPTGGQVISMDLNLNVARAWVRTYLLRAFPTFRLVADQPYQGTHGSRAIDTILVSRRLNPLKWIRGDRLKVLAVKDSDHRTVIVHLQRTAFGKR